MITPIPGYEQYYGATKDGRVYSFNYAKSGKTKELAQSSLFNKTRENKTMYKRAKMYFINKSSPTSIHRIIALTFVENPNPEKYNQVNHIDGDKGNNNSSNLEWVDNSMNQKHAFETGLRVYHKGEKHHGAILTENDVREIREKLKKSYRGILIDLAKEYGVTNYTIFDIRKGKSWRWLK